MNLQELYDGCPFYNKKTSRVECSLRPTLDRAFIWPKPIPEKIGSIIIPDSVRATGKFVLGLVVNIGPGYADEKMFHPTFIKPLDVVIYDKNVPWFLEVESPVDGKVYKLTLLGERDIRAIVVQPSDPEGVELGDIHCEL